MRSIEDESKKALSLGKKNSDAIERLNRHCVHAEVEFPNGHSPVGQALRMPIGIARVHCVHAPATHEEGHDVLELAVSFYERHCGECQFRAPTGVVPSIVAEVERRRSQRELELRQRAASLERRVREWRARSAARRATAACEDAQARDLLADVDALDGQPLDEGAPDEAATAAAARRIEAVARRAPALFSDAIVESLLVVAVDRRQPAIWRSLEAIVRGSRDHGIDRAIVARKAIRALEDSLLPEAGNALAEVVASLSPDERARGLPRLVLLAAGDEDGLGREARPPAPRALLAALEVASDAVVGCVIDLLGDDDDACRAAAAVAADVVLGQSPFLLESIGPALVLSVRGQDAGYAGYPSPTANASAALRASWQREPQRTRHIIETSGASLRPDVRAILVGAVRWLPAESSDLALREATEFLLERLAGDWGAEAAEEVGHELEGFARDHAGALVGHVDALLGHLLSLCGPETREPVIHQPGNPVDASASALERISREVKMDGLRSRLARTLGLVAKADPDAVIPRVDSALAASVGDSDKDSTARRALLVTLASAASPSTVDRILPTLYTHLLQTDQSVRAAAVEVWAACAGAAATLPQELGDLASALLSDSYVVVHKAMLHHLPRLRLPGRNLEAVLPLVVGWANAYTDRDPRTLEAALWDLLCLADRLSDLSKRERVLRFVLSKTSELGPESKERILLDGRLSGWRSGTFWAESALTTLAARGISVTDYHWGDKLLTALLEEPRGLAEVDLEKFRTFAMLFLPRFAFPAAFAVELLQCVQRWSDAANLAGELEASLTPTTENSQARAYLGLVALASEAEAAVSRGPFLIDPTLDRLGKTLRGLEAPDELASYVGARRETLRALSQRRDSADLEESANRLERVAEKIGQGPQTAGLSDEVRAAGAESVRIAAMLLRYDAAIRGARARDATSFLDAAKRRSRTLIGSAEGSAFGSLRLFWDLTLRISGADAVDEALEQLRCVSIPIPLAARVKGQRLPRQKRPTEVEQPSRPVVVCLLRLDGQPIADVAVVRRDHVYLLQLDLYLDGWPDWAERCEIRFLTVVRGLALPRLSIPRERLEAKQSGFCLREQIHIQCDVQMRAGQPPLDCPIEVHFDSGHRQVAADVAGYRRLRLRPHDPSRDGLTGQAQVDQRLLEFYSRLHNEPTLDASDVRAFCRMFSACVRAGQQMMFDRLFRAGSRVREADFHRELEDILRADSELEGRISRGDRLAGGFVDLIHDGIVAELKVERQRAATMARCAKYLGQTSQYAVGRGCRLSILFVLDHSPKAKPVAPLVNYVDWLVPGHHGLDPAQYPSLVGVLILNTNSPTPSAWSRRRTADAAGG